jgi:ligand-binding SRPBCC domain-containing protein
MQPLEFRSRLGAPTEVVWERVSTVEGVNDELRPLMRMTFPRHVRKLEPEQVELGARLCRSWLLLFGLLPVDYDDLTLVELTPGSGFRESSSMLSMRSWEHERRLKPDRSGCIVHDRVAYTPRLGLPPPLLAPVVRTVFRHRHRRLRMRFGEG